MPAYDPPALVELRLSPARLVLVLDLLLEANALNLDDEQIAVHLRRIRDRLLDLNLGPR